MAENGRLLFSENSGRPRPSRDKGGLEYRISLKVRSGRSFISQPSRGGGHSGGGGRNAHLQISFFGGHSFDFVVIQTQSFPIVVGRHINATYEEIVNTREREFRDPTPSCDFTMRQVKLLLPQVNNFILLFGNFRFSRHRILIFENPYDTLLWPHAAA